MNRTQTPAIDQLLREGLLARTAGETGDLLSMIVQKTVATPQRKAWRWQSPAGLRPLLLLAALALLLAAMIAALVMSHEVRPAPVTVPHANGEIVTIGPDGCTLVAVKSGSADAQPYADGIPNCYPIPGKHINPLGTYSIAWSPNGDRLAVMYTFFCGGCGSPEAVRAIDSHAAGLWVFDPASNQATQLMECPTECDQAEVSWSADGSQLAIVRENRVWVVSARGDGARPISDVGSVARHAVWSPESSRLAWADSSKLVVAASDGSGRKIVFERPGFTIDAISWAADGRSIVVASATASGGALEIVAADGQGLISEVQTPAGTRPLFGRWSPDGRSLAYVGVRPVRKTQGERELSAAVVVLRRGSSGRFTPTRVMQDVTVTEVTGLTWSPDSQDLAMSAMVRNDASGYGTYIVPISGSGARLLGGTDGRPAAWRPVESPDQ